MYHIGGNTYALIRDHKNGWNYEVFRERYSEVLDRYDFIVGDWGYNQLRLKGFFKEANNKGAKEASIGLLHDYLNEYCNFGCAYFIIEKLASRKGQTDREREDGDDAEQELAERAAEADKPKDGEVKLRQHYHRSQEPRHRAPQEKAVLSSVSDSPKARQQENGRVKEAEQRSRGQDNRGSRPEGSRGGREHDNGHRRDDNGRRKDHEGHRPKDNESGRSREQGERHQHGKGKEQENKGKPHGNGGSPDKNKGQPPPKNKSNDHHRIRDKERDRSRDKEKAEPLA